MKQVLLGSLLSFFDYMWFLCVAEAACSGSDGSVLSEHCSHNGGSLTPGE